MTLLRAIPTLKWDTWAPAGRYIEGGTTGGYHLGSAVGYIGGEDWMDHLGSAVGYIGGGICRASVVCIGRSGRGEERTEEADVTLHSNNPTLKGGE